MDRPASGVLRSFVKCLPLRHAQHQLVKTIVRLDCTAAAWSPHAFHHNCSGQSVARTDGSPIEGPRAEEPTHVDLALHHYATKSRRDFEQKMVRGSGMKRQRCGGGALERGGVFEERAAWRSERGVGAVERDPDDPVGRHERRCLMNSEHKQGTL